jgi:hypothetical protein
MKGGDSKGGYIRLWIRRGLIENIIQLGKYLSGGVPIRAEGRGEDKATAEGTSTGGTRLHKSPRSGEALWDWPVGLAGGLRMVAAMRTIKKGELWPGSQIR